MPTILKLLMEMGGGFSVAPPEQQSGRRPSVVIVKVKEKYQLTFKLPKVVPGATFLGIYPARATLPDADGLQVGDYALLQTGEILQIER